MKGEIASTGGNDKAEVTNLSGETAQPIPAAEHDPLHVVKDTNKPKQEEEEEDRHNFALAKDGAKVADLTT